MDEWEDQLQADFVQRAQCVAVHHTSCFFESLVRKPATTRCKKLQELHSWLLGTLRTSTHVHPVQHSSVARRTPAVSHARFASRPTPLGAWQPGSFACSPRGGHEQSVGQPHHGQAWMGTAPWGAHGVVQLVWQHETLASHWRAELPSSCC